jgi:hypothetical protein
MICIIGSRHAPRGAAPSRARSIASGVRRGRRNVSLPASNANGRHTGFRQRSCGRRPPGNTRPVGGLWVETTATVSSAGESRIGFFGVLKAFA